MDYRSDAAAIGGSHGGGESSNVGGRGARAPAIGRQESTMHSFQNIRNMIVWYKRCLPCFQAASAIDDSGKPKMGSKTGSPPRIPYKSRHFSVPVCKTGKVLTGNRKCCIFVSLAFSRSSKCWAPSSNFWPHSLTVAPSALAVGEWE